MDYSIRQLLPTLKDYAEALTYQDVTRFSKKKFLLQYREKQHLFAMKEWIHHVKYLAKKELKGEAEYKQLLYIIFGLKYSTFEAMKKMKRIDALHTSLYLVKLRKIERQFLISKQLSSHAQEIYLELKELYAKQKHRFELLNIHYNQLIYHSKASEAQKLLTKIHFLISEIEGLKALYGRLFWLSKESPKQALSLLNLIVRTKNPLFEALLQIGFYDTDIGVEKSEHLKKGYFYNEDVATLFFDKVFDRPLLLEAKLRNIQPFI